MIRLRDASIVGLTVAITAFILAAGILGFVTAAKWVLFTWLLPNSTNGCAFYGHWYGRFSASGVVWHCFDDSSSME